MKWLLFLILSAFTISSSGQAYIPTLEEGKEWEIFKPMGLGQSITSWYYINCDTTISGKDYFMIRNSKSNDLMGLVREDTLQKKIFMLSLLSSQEHLYIDYDLKTGDSTIFNNAYTMYVDSVTIDFKFQQNRKVIHFSNFMKYIEGGGNSFYGINDKTTTYEQISNISSFWMCGQNPNAVKYFSRSAKVFPNPAIDKISIEIDGITKPKNYEIYNITGQLIVKSIFEPVIDISSLSKGFYVLRLDDYSPIKFVKE